MIHFLAYIPFFASTWGSSDSGNLSEWVRAFFKRPTFSFLSFSLAAFFPYFQRFGKTTLTSVFLSEKLKLKFFFWEDIK
jgi:hypothetical protein